MSESPNDLLIAAAIAGDTATMESLLTSGEADPTHFDAAGLTPLMHAAIHDQPEAVSLLLSHGAPWNALSPSLLSAGDFALLHSHQEPLRLLVDSALRSELIFSTIARKSKNHNNDKVVKREKEYLDKRVEFGEGRLVEEDGGAVMMAWERPLMEAHARAVCANGGRVLNIGFGMGLVDEAIERYEGLTEHVIVEAHPDVYERMMRSGWGERKNVKVVFGRWQDVVGQLESYDGE